MSRVGPVTGVREGPPAGSVPSWRWSARCVEVDPETFFPGEGESPAAAKLVCAGCEVRAECLGFAVARGERYGVWGGLSEQERRRMRRLAAGPVPAAASGRAA